jgi:hypothetical protein
LKVASSTGPPRAALEEREAAGRRLRQLRGDVEAGMVRALGGAAQPLFQFNDFSSVVGERLLPCRSCWLASIAFNIRHNTAILSQADASGVQKHADALCFTRVNDDSARPDLRPELLHDIVRDIDEVAVVELPHPFARWGLNAVR